jgi:serine/threonine-protein kinase
MIDKVFANRYRLIEKIGIGGMAAVYKATDETLGRTVAIKVMLPQYSADATFAARFKQEAQAAANLQSPYIVNIYDWGHDAADDTYYIVMEYVRGTDLKSAIEQRGPINQRKVAEIGAQICSALSVAHGYDIIHRDIKPHNIMVQPDGNAKVMDFGIARAGNSNMTQTGSVLGSAYYVSPEQAQGKPLTAATDIYSLGIVLYEAVTGRVPFEGEEPVAVALKQVNEPPLPPRKINRNIDAALETIILKAMQKDPANRFATAEQMRLALADYLAGRPLSGADAAATQVLSGAVPGAVVAVDAGGVKGGTAVMPQVGNYAQKRPGSANKDGGEQKKNRTPLIIALVAILVVAAIAVAIVLSQCSGGGDIAVPKVVGLTEAQARQAIKDANLQVGANIVREYNDTVPTGIVISQDPAADAKVNKNAEINLTISLGPPAANAVVVPNLKGLTASEAEAKLTELGLTYGFGESIFDDDVEEGQVCSQNPKANTEVAPGTKVTYNLSKGPDTESVPNVVGMTKANATSVLTNAGFKVRTATGEYSDTVDKGNVMKQSPTNGSPAKKGDTVTITVSKGPQPVAQVTVPNLSGMDYVQAKAAVEKLGLVLSYDDNPTTGQTVVDQDPAPGKKVDKGSTVTVVFADPPVVE